MVPYLAVSFSVYDHLKAQVKEDRTTRQLWWYPLAKVGMGATASTVAQVCIGTSRAGMPALHSCCRTIHAIGKMNCIAVKHPAPCNALGQSTEDL